MLVLVLVLPLPLVLVLVLLLLLLLLAPREHHIVRLPVQALLRAGGRLLALLGLTRAVAPRLGLGALLALLLPQHLGGARARDLRRRRLALPLRVVAQRLLLLCGVLLRVCMRSSCIGLSGCCACGKTARGPGDGMPAGGRAAPSRHRSSSRPPTPAPCCRRPPMGCERSAARCCMPSYTGARDGGGASMANATAACCCSSKACCSDCDKT